MSENLWRAQLDRLAEEAPAAVQASLRSRARRVVDEDSMRRELAELGYSDETIERSARRARGSIRRPRFVRTMALTFIAAALATSQCMSVPPRGGGFTKAATKAMEGRLARYVRGAEGRGVDRATALLVWRVLADHANQSGFCFPKVPTISKEGGISERSVQRTIVVLEELGYLCVYPREMERGVPPEWEEAPEDEIAGGRSHMYLLLPGGLDDEPSLAESSPDDRAAASSAHELAPMGSSTAAPSSPITLAPSVKGSPAPRPGAARSAVLVAIAPTLEAPPEWARAFAEPLARLKGRIGVEVPAWRCYEMAVDLERGLGAAATAVEQAVQKLLNERAANKPVDELRCLEVIRFCVQSARPSPAPADGSGAVEPHPIAAWARAEKAQERAREEELEALRARPEHQPRRPAPARDPPPEQ